MEILNSPIYLSPPTVDEAEIVECTEALNSGWVSTYGSYNNQFKDLLDAHYQRETVLTNSGTSAIHLSLITAGITEGDYVLCANLSFASSAFPILYQKANPVFVGVNKDDWNISPEILEECITDLHKKNIFPKALILVYAYGMPSKYFKEIKEICSHHKILIIEDAAEALGSYSNNEPLGSLADFGIISFNGNKIITTSAGGALICNNKEQAEFAQKIASQAKEKSSHYLHKHIGFNYLPSNVLSAIGVAQYKKLDSFVKKRRETFTYYQKELANLVDIEYQEESSYEKSNRWLSSFILKDVNIEFLIQKLADEKIESRHIFYPLHKNPVFKNYLYYGKNVEDYLFEFGISLPSGNALQNNELERIINLIKIALKK